MNFCLVLNWSFLAVCQNLQLMFLEDLVFHKYSDLVIRSRFDSALKFVNCCSSSSSSGSVLLLRATFEALQFMPSFWIPLTCVSLSIAQSSTF